MWSEVVEPSKHLPTQHRNPMIDEIVDFEDRTKTIIKNLIGGTNVQDVFPIVGMGGQGKTTFARKVYDNDIIVSHFDVRAWCIISQTFQRRGLLQEIFSQVTGLKDKGDKVDELADKLRKSLMGKRYLIVLDDMWDIMAWDDLRFSFPESNNGSRIVVTTRLHSVCMRIKETEPYTLPLLKLEESWELLKKKVFQKEGCPHELHNVGRAVADRCKGLPLVVILVAGIIKRKKMEVSWWSEVENALLSYLSESEEYSLSTMQLSYDNLPDHIRPCLLYMGMFPEDHIIPVYKLICLWIVEGFVHNTESSRLEEAAERYLMDLISRNLVTVSKRWYNGKVKYCHVHDIVLDFCLRRSREKKFMLVTKGHPRKFQPSDWTENRLSFHFNFDLSELSLLGSEARKPSNEQLRSVVTWGLEFVGWNIFPQISKLRLLIVLDLSSITIYSLSSATFNQLIHLKYLAIQTRVVDFQPESHLCNLETLIVGGLEIDIVLPAIFWTMEKLRHFDIHRVALDFHYLEDKEQQIFGESSKLENLRYLRTVRLSPQDAHWVDMLSRRCPNLQELCICVRPSGGRTCNLKLEGFTQLQSLQITSYVIFSGLQLPSDIKKLILQMPLITRRAVSIIAKLPNLEYLKFEKSAFESREWCLGDNKFDKLKILKLMSVDILRWDASEESFSQLETLVISWCWKLEEIPGSFAGVQTLQQIKLIQCKNDSLEASAVKIKEEVEEFEGSDRINLIIEDW